MLETMGSRWHNARNALAACKTLAFPSAVRRAVLDERNSLAVHLRYRFHNLSCGASIDHSRERRRTIEFRLAAFAGTLTPPPFAQKPWPSRTTTTTRRQP